MAPSFPDFPVKFPASLSLHCFSHAGLDQLLYWSSLFICYCIQQFPQTFFYSMPLQFKPSLSDSKASDFHILPCPGRTTMPMVGMGWDESTLRLKRHSLPLFLSKVQLFIFNKFLPNYHMTLVNFQSPKMVVFENSVHFYHCLLVTGIALLCHFSV